MTTNTDFIIPRDGYLTFDALTMKQFIKDRLNETGVFTDQNYEGSYISTVNEIISYMFHVLMFYLNNTSTESKFSDVQIYENMNRIVKSLGYNPIGKQTSTLAFTMTAGSEFNTGLYTIPRYSLINNGAASYSFNEDITFAKTETLGTAQVLDDISNQKLLYQGSYVEYPQYTSTGNENEIIYFTPGDNVKIDHFNIDVYVKSNGLWKEWSNTTSLYLEDAFSEMYEIRLNENKHYEIKFGNDINGKKLTTGDIVQIYYLESNGKDGEIGVNGVYGKKVSLFNTVNYNEILTSLQVQNTNDILYLNTAEIQNLYFGNSNISTYYQDDEDVESIRENAPDIFRSQFRLVTEKDYENYVKTNFANVIHDVKVASNNKYMTEYMKYYYDIGITNPNNISNVLYNQVHFSDTCNFNNIYLTVVPKTISNTKNPTSVLSPSQSELILSTIDSVKTLTSDVIIIDPVYIAFDVCGQGEDNTVNVDDKDSSYLQIVKDSSSRRDNDSLKLDVINVFNNYFSRTNMLLGDQISISEITTSILGLDGIKTFNTVKENTGGTDNVYNGLSLLMWNPVYPSDKQLLFKNITQSYFKYAYLYDVDHFDLKIKIVSETDIFENIEY